MGDDRHGGVRDLSETTFRLSQSCCRPEGDQKRSERGKILGIFFAPHFGCSTTGNFRAKLQFRKRFAIAKPCFALQFPLENTSVETVTTRELVRSVGRRRVRPSRCRAGSSPSCQPPPQDTGGFWSSPIRKNFICGVKEMLLLR